MVLDVGANTKLPVSRMIPAVELEIFVVMLVVQIGDPRRSSKTMLPSSDIVSFDEFGSEIGLTRLAIHTGVCFETLLYQMARYHLSGVVPSAGETNLLSNTQILMAFKFKDKKSFFSSSKAKMSREQLVKLENLTISINFDVNALGPV